MNYSTVPLGELWRSEDNEAYRLVALDQAKFNLVWLVYPDLDAVGMQAVPLNVAESMNYMDKTTRSYLMGDPIVFMRYWRGIDTGELALAEHMPDDRLATMDSQARDAHERLYGVSVEANVVYVNRWKSAA